MLLPIIICIYLASVFFNQLEAEMIYEQTLNIKSMKQTLLDNKTKLIYNCLFAGLISGMLGIGGGMVILPLLIELGFELNSSQNTSNLLLIFSCTLNFLHYFFSVCYI